MKNYVLAAAAVSIFSINGIMTETSYASTVVRSAVGADAASIQSTVDQFRLDLGINNGLGPCTGACLPGEGRREINWDAVPDSFSSGGANPFPGNFFNGVAGDPAGRVRGVEFSTTGAFEVSADSDSDNDSNPGPVAPLFGNHNPDNADDFAAFSAQRIFGLVGTNEMDVFFNVPGSPGTQATVKGFGVVFTDVEAANSTKLDFYDINNNLLHAGVAPHFVFSGADSFDSFSFLGVSFDTASVYRVHITNGGYDLDLNPFGIDDSIAMDDFIYGEPLAISAVPEPSMILLLSTGLLGLFVWRRKHS
ncbi:PEP-CTERM sorting domain-containing protein [Nitrosomonas sp.]|uniref:PEP-CTERM sorting domain-containing protein n=1 Tax=Nitrosomonas sp. TaxID=42353 RepID=UPI0025CE3EC9|nr:PEP-CTERM sorting domain-containing protein [Nitrosomonas sp.]